MAQPASRLSRAIAAAAVLALSPATQAQQTPFKISGFVSLVAGRINGNLSDSYVGPSEIDGHQCPCYIADWGNAGIYEEKWSFEPESRVGLQFKYTINPDISAVAQVVVRGSDNHPNLQWAYVSYAPTRSVEIQLGRKRIPLYYYSDFQDIGMSYPWAGVPPELYGWEATNYNGASFRYKTSIGETAVSASMFAGREKVRDSLYQQLYYEGKTRVTWDRLAGADLEVSHGPVTVRGVYIQTTVRTTNPGADLDDTARLKAYGIAANLELERWFVLSEVTQLTRDFEAGYKVTAPAMTIGAGYRIGDWTPFLNFARYKERSSDLSVYSPQSYDRASFTLRRDIDARSSLKGQIDRQKDVTRNFGGDSTVLRVAYDRLF